MTSRADESRGRVRCGRCVAIAGAVLWLSGCGQDVYERRLQETSALYSHIQVLDENLSGEWRDQVISLRPPKQFRQVPPPAPSQGGEETAAGFDPRQPDFVNVELPGLRATFRTELNSAPPGGNEGPQAAYIYVLSNHDLKAPTSGTESQGVAADPAQFSRDVMRTLSDLLGAPVQPSVDTLEWPKEELPRTINALFPVGSQNPFMPVKYQSAVMEARIRDVPMDFLAYMHSEGSTQVLLLFVIPHDVVPGERIRERIDLSLETLRLSGAPPAGAAPAPGVAPGGAAAPSAGI